MSRDLFTDEEIVKLEEVVKILKKKSDMSDLEDAETLDDITFDLETFILTHKNVKEVRERLKR